MARTTVNANAAFAGAYPALPVGAGTADLVETAADGPTDLQTPIVDSKTVVIAHNTDSGAHTITITSAVDPFNRIGDITTYSVAAGKIARFGPFKTQGWNNTGGLLIDISDPLLRVTILTLP